jgi:hypothetical protein
LYNCDFHYFEPHLTQTIFIGCLDWTFGFLRCYDFDCVLNLWEQIHEAQWFISANCFKRRLWFEY